ncbi:MAG: TolC family protein [Proteobacteria bacterium]|nr:MAG: TolC family protein [Pseudomonadota bacterium]
MTHINKNNNFKLVSVSLSLSLTLCLWGSLGLAQENVKIVAPSTGGALTLDEAMRLAYDHSFNRKATEQDQLGSQARQTSLRGGMGPKVSLEAARGWIDTDINKLAGVTLPTGQRYPDQISSVGAVVSQPITQIFAARERLASEQKVEESTKSQLLVDGNDAKLRGAEAYIQALKAVRFLAINRESRDLIGKQKKDAGSLRSSGKLSELDFSRFELAASEAESLVIDAEAQLKVAGDNLREALGLSPDQELNLSELGDLSVPQAAQVLERNELQSATRRVEALESQVKAQKVDYWPQVNAFARYSRDFAAHDVNVNFLGLAINVPKEDFRDQFSYGFNLQWDIWDWGTRSGRQAELGTLVAKARINHDALASRLRVETSQASAEWERANQNLKNAQVADHLSANILKSFDLRFRNGLATTTDLLSIQRDRTRAQANLANATYDLHGALLRKKRAEGGAL